MSTQIDPRFDAKNAAVKWKAEHGSPEAAADALEQQQMAALNGFFVKPAFYHLVDGKQALDFGGGKKVQHGEDRRLPPMPEAPTLQDFFRYRLSWNQKHLLQSAELARKNGCSDQMVLACLLHDISVAGFIASDHGYWGAQMIEPYVDEEVSWAIRMHQSCRFFPDPDFNYTYPKIYERMFGPDYELPQYLKDDYQACRQHKWYASARTICVNDFYSFDTQLTVPPIEAFEDVIGRHFRTPREGLGNDRSPSAHMWRTLIRPANAL